MSDDTPKPPTVVSLSDKRKARAQAEEDEFLSGLAERLRARAEKAEAAGDREMAIEMRAATEAVLAADYLSEALFAMEAAHEEWEKLKQLKSEQDKP
jgi:hypothetical protein